MTGGGSSKEERQMAEASAASGDTITPAPRISHGDLKVPKRHHGGMMRSDKQLRCITGPDEKTNDDDPPSGQPQDPLHTQRPASARQEQNPPAIKKRTMIESIRWTCWHVITFSWINLLLIFVPAGIATAQIDGIHGGIVFGLNCVAVIPLAGLLAHATETVAGAMGDALGALITVSFGNVVELIIFIALRQDKIRIVQASLLGSILANLLLILGMAFFLGGMRYREQLYNSTVTQMSACLLSLSVISLVLPTAFHASFHDTRLADVQSLKISRGTSVVLALVYVIFLVFQLKSHAFLYESTPRQLVDAEATPGPAAAWLETDSSEGDSSYNSDSSMSEDSRSSVRNRVRRVLRNKCSRLTVASRGASVSRRSSITATNSPLGETDLNILETVNSDGSTLVRSRSREPPRSPSYDPSDQVQRGRRRRSHRRKRRHRRYRDDVADQLDLEAAGEASQQTAPSDEPPRLELSYPVHPNHGAMGDASDGVEPGTLHFRSPFARFRNLTPTLFSPKPEAVVAFNVPSTTERGRSAGLPVGDSGGQTDGIGINTTTQGEQEELSRTAAIILLVVSTGLVALCAEFLVSTIEDVTKSSSIGETFIGLIVLPIVGNAAEHITSITVALKNKMDLGIGVAIGSSIQIALFITPVVVILGWILDKPMSLYFTLFETVCLFVSAFIVNFLVLDGRSNYMEGALLCAVYLIIGVVAFYYPEAEEASKLGSGEGLAN